MVSVAYRSASTTQGGIGQSERQIPIPLHYCSGPIRSSAPKEANS